jgi:hypothetical protein
MDALFMKPMHKAVWAQLRGRKILETEDEFRGAPIIDEKKLEGVSIEQVESRASR